MSIFLWYSKSSKQTGTWLADKLKIELHGTVPPRDFEGTVICWGASPSVKFKWEKRNFQSIFNDPRVIRPLINRELLFKKLTDADIPTAKFITLPVAEEGAPAVVHSYADLCASLEVEPATGFLACTAGGFKRIPVKSDAQLAAAVAEERTCVTTAQFAKKERIRIFVANGVVAGGAKFTTSMPAETIPSNLAGKVSAGWEDFTPAQCAAVFKRAVDLKLISTTSGAWVPFSISDANMRNRALTIATILGFGFCAVDFDVDGSGTVINVVTTPNLREVTTVQSAITNAVASWVYKNSRTPKDILLEAIAGSTSEEVSSLLEELSNLKGAIKLTLKKEKGGEKAVKPVGGGADSPPAKSA
jgi:hypothetical protein